MFNLEQAVAHWRAELAAAGLESLEILDELEGHLRADITQQVQSGVAAEQAFRLAVQRIGPPHALGAEFKKAGATGAQKVMTSICIILVAFILWMSGFTFVQMQFSPAEQIIAYAGVALSLLVACRWRYTVPFLPVISGGAKRIGVGAGCIALGFVVTNLLSQFVLPHFEHGFDRQIPAIGFWLLFPITIGLCLGLGLMMTARDREHWAMGRRERSLLSTQPGPG
jgi:hypothetical protein